MMRFIQKVHTTLGVFLSVIIGIATASELHANESALDRLIRAYPDFLDRYDKENIYWKDGTVMPISDGKIKSFDEKLRDASIEDQLSLRYQRGSPKSIPGPEDDPGRFRNVRFFNKMYGDCKKGDVQKQLAEVRWVGSSGDQKLKATVVNQVASKLQAVSNELKKLKPEFDKYIKPSAGTFVCRAVADTGVPSMHGWGVAIDLNTKFSDYWHWRKNLPYRNRIPFQIVEVFERHGFIWGGKWGHYDTMHFEYRPEMFE